MQVRPAEFSEIGAVAAVWYESWRDAHATLVPAELTRLRTLESFQHRVAEALPSTRVVGMAGVPVGLCIIRGDELYQLFVSAHARGAGVADALLHDAEARLTASGVGTAWLACAIGNHRAARFYQKHGWHRTGSVVFPMDTPGEPFPLEVWRYEKSLGIHPHL